MADKRWIAETLFDDLGFRMSYQVDKVLYETQTEHQHLVLFEQPFFGKMLMLDGATQITKRDEFIYQEMMSHVPLFAHGNAREVLIIGGGDCGIAEEVLKHKTVKRLTQVEIDPAVVEFAKRAFPGIHQAGVRRQALRKRDRRRHEIRRRAPSGASTSSSSTPPTRRDRERSCSAKNSTRACKRCMNKGGILVTQNGVPIFQPRELARASPNSGGCLRTAPATSPRSRPISAVTWRWAGRPTTSGCATRRQRR